VERLQQDASIPVNCIVSMKTDSETKREPSPITFGCPRFSLGNHYVYVVLSSRARGLSVGINLCPEGHCNFQCAYCEAHPPVISPPHEIKLERLSKELHSTVDLVLTKELRQFPPFEALDDDLFELKQVSISGNGEPTLSPSFAETIQCILHARALGTAPFIKTALLTNGSHLCDQPVRDAIRMLTFDDEIWIKLDAGTQEYMSRINGGEASLKTILDNILSLGKERPVGIQSLFPLFENTAPTRTEISAYIERLKELKESGAQITKVQVYSAGRTARNTSCDHLPLRTLFEICRQIKTETGLNAEVF